MIDWKAISAEHAPLVWRTAARILSGRGSREADIADCFQETFLAALQFSKTDSVQNWPGLLQRIATSRALDSLRRRVRDTRVGSIGDPDTFSTPANDPPRQIENDELMARLQSAVALLPEPMGELFCLRHLNEMSYEDIAEQLGMSVAAVGTALTRARARLRELMTPYLSEGSKPR